MIVYIDHRTVNLANPLKDRLMYLGIPAFIENNLDADILVKDDDDKLVLQVWETKDTDALTSYLSGLWESELRERTLKYGATPEYLCYWRHPNLSQSKIPNDQFTDMVMNEFPVKYPHWRFRALNANISLDDYIEKIVDWIVHPPQPQNVNVPKLVRVNKQPKGLILSMTASMDKMTEDLAFFIIDEELIKNNTDKYCWGDLLNLTQKDWREYFSLYYNGRDIQCTPDDWYECIGYNGITKKERGFIENKRKKKTERPKNETTVYE